MFGYVSIADLSHEVRNNLHRIPRTVDLVVGVPRSGTGQFQPSKSIMR